MPDHSSVISLARTIDLGLAAACWGFVVVESLSKRVDVTALKTQLDLRDKQLMAVVIADAEKAVLPFLLNSLPATSLGLDEEQDEQPSALGENSKDALALSLRTSERNLHCMYRMRRLPKKILRLNGFVYWGVLAVAVVASIGGAVIFLYPDMSIETASALTVIPLLSSLFAVISAVIRHLSVQSAENNIIDTSV